MSDYPVFAVKSIGLSRCGGRNPRSLQQAAAHNLRSSDGYGFRDTIDVSRSASNIILTGPDTASGVQGLVSELLADVDTKRLKRDHVQAIEVMFSLPAASAFDLVAYFKNCLAWWANAMPLPVLSGIIHLDEPNPHLHVLALPVHHGKHVGGLLIDRDKLKQLRGSFFNLVAGPAGLKRESAKLRGASKEWAVERVLSECKAMGLPASMGPLWSVFEASVMREPTPYMLALKLDASEPPRAIALQPSDPPSPIALQNEAQKHQGLSCVALLHKTTVSEPLGDAPVITSLAELWERVGCRSTWLRPHPNARPPRRVIAREAIKTAQERTKPSRGVLAPTAAHEANMVDLVRIRDAEPLPLDW